MIGTTVPIRIEAENSATLDGAIHNHSITTLTDALATQALLESISPTISSATISNIFDAAAPARNASLEGLINPLARLFGFSPVPLEDRDQLYQRIYAISDAVRTMTAAPSGLHFSIVDLTQSANAAATLGSANSGSGLAYRYALQQLNPFALLATDAQGNVSDADTQAFYQAYASELSLYDPSTGSGNITAQWLTDRAAFLAAHLQANTENASFPVGLTNDFLDFHDAALGVDVNVVPISTRFDQPPTGPSQLYDYWFGGLTGETHDGSAAIDHLFGREGDDTLDSGRSVAILHESLWSFVASACELREARTRMEHASIRSIR